MNLFQVTKKQPSSGLELKTFTGNPVTFTPSYSEELPAPFNGINLKAAIACSQDLHGYDHPWSAGGGKNKYSKEADLADDTWTNNVDGSYSVNSNNELIVTCYDSSDFSGVFGNGVQRTMIREQDTETTVSFDIKASVAVSNAYIFAQRMAISTSYERKTITIPAGNTSIAFSFYGGGNNVTFTVKNIMINYDGYSIFEPYSNICPIVGHSELNLVRCGINLWDEETESGYINSSTGGEVSDPTKIRMKNYVRVGANSTYFYKTPVAFYICCYDENKTFLGRIGGSRDTTFTTLPNTVYIRCGFESAYGTTYNHDISINCPSTDTSYHAYNGQTFTVSFGQTVYGGVYDKSGRLTITHGIVDLGNLNWNYSSGSGLFYSYGLSDAYAPQGDNTYIANALCSIFGVKSRAELPNNNYCFSINYSDTKYLSVKDTDYTDANAFKTAVTGQMLAYELNQPIVIDVPSISVFAENGTNNIVSDCGGDVEVTCLI